MFNHTRQREQLRHGTTIVETAIVLPVFILFVFAIFEFGHAQFVNNMINSACRSGARMGSVEGTTTSQVESRVSSTLGTVAPVESISIFVKDASVYDVGTPPTDGEGIEAMPDMELSDAEPRQMFVVRARVPYNDIALVPMPFLKNLVLDGQSFMRHE